MALNIKITNFEGPFDLLLHLIKKSEMDIYDIKIYEITNQYLQYLNGMKELDLEITSEFIVVAATLLEIKSYMLLPKAENKDDEGEEEDPRQKLIERLVEYKKFKAASKYLQKQMAEAGYMFGKKPEIIEEKTPKQNNEDILKNVTMLDLYNLYNELVNRYRNKLNDTTHELQTTILSVDQYRIEDKMIELSSILIDGDKYIFRDIIRNYKNKMEKVVTFLALLELIKVRNVKIYQEDNFKEIYVERIDSSNEKRSDTDRV